MSEPFATGAKRSAHARQVHPYLLRRGTQPGLEKFRFEVHRETDRVRGHYQTGNSHLVKLSMVGTRRSIEMPIRLSSGSCQYHLRLAIIRLYHVSLETVD